MKISNFIIYSLFCIIIIATFVLPNLVLSYNDYGFKMAVLSKKEGDLNGEVQDIYLVKMIHEIADGSAKMEIVTEKTGHMIEFVKVSEGKPMEGIQKELVELEKKEILKLDSEPKWGEMTSIDKTYETEDKQYIFKNLTLYLEEQLYEINIETKTGKIISLTCNETQINKNISKEELLRKYVEYLNLNIIDDWVYEDKVLKSEKAGLIAVSAKSGNRRIICVNTTNILYEENIAEHLDIN